MIKNLISIPFRISVAAFLLGGLVIVVLQAAGLMLGNGDFVNAVSDILAPWVYGAAGVAGLLAFVLSYFPHAADADGGLDDVTPRPATIAEHA